MMTMTMVKVVMRVWTIHKRKTMLKSFLEGLEDEVNGVEPLSLLLFDRLQPII
jgi:hypothetical protein